MTVEPVRRCRVCFSSYEPGGPVVRVPVPLVVARHYVQQHQVPRTRLRVDVSERDANRGEHPPTRPGDDHLRPKLTKLVPQLFVVESTSHRIQLGAVRVLTDLALSLLLDDLLQTLRRLLPFQLGLRLRPGLQAGHDGRDAEVCLPGHLVRVGEGRRA